MGTLSHLAIAEPDQAQDVCDRPSRFTHESLFGMPVEWLMGLACVLGKRSHRGIGAEFPVLIEDNARVTKVSDELVNLASSLKESSIPDIVDEWIAWLDINNERVLGANRTPTERKRLRARLKEVEEYFGPKAKKLRVKWDKKAHESLRNLLLTIIDLSKKAVRRKKALFLVERP